MSPIEGCRLATEQEADQARFRVSKKRNPYSDQVAELLNKGDLVAIDIENETRASVRKIKYSLFSQLKYRGISGLHMLVTEKQGSQGSFVIVISRKQG